MADCLSHALSLDTLFDLILGLSLFYTQVYMTYHQNF